ncbi:helix-turn-helix transcriptional regulator [Spongiactinospora sp. TRM90649]|uniref:helix-turn-helix domain-containing protein n=1 Tax=Spongiactinospora sp. TRM90649 TaxID=3031114 RepID=UPI0023F68D01|nr:helix-turn-helix transcriptional regulator [Spongiactinospora sp. TRM90649]MDF5753151.1 helix-turn-helix transcriptional regulator [Spongiactinospora sp. TRM90649]
MVEQPPQFGKELRKRRLAAGLSLTGLAKRVNYSKGQLSKVERGLKRPSRLLAGLCDVELAAEGSLITFLDEEITDAEGVTTNDGGTAGSQEVWLMGLSPTGGSRFQSMNRRQIMTTGAASLVGLAGVGIGGRMPGSAVEGESLLSASRSIFDEYRRLGQSVEPGLLLPALIAQTHSLREYAEQADPRTRRALLLLGSRYAEYIGWLVQEMGDEQATLWWTRRAVEMAAAGGDQDFAAYGMARHALITLYRNDAGQTIELARRAQRDTVLPRIQGLASMHEAQGHALAGNHTACMSALDRARTALDRPSADEDTPIIGPTNLPDPVTMITGWCLYDLGRPREAAEILGSQLAGVRPEALRTRVRYGVRQALAHAAAGDVDHACHLISGLLNDVATLRSATVAMDLPRLARVLARYTHHPATRDLAPRLGALTTTGLL